MDLAQIMYILLQKWVIFFYQVHILYHSYIEGSLIFEVSFQIAEKSMTYFKLKCTIFEQDPFNLILNVYKCTTTSPKRPLIN